MLKRCFRDEERHLWGCESKSTATLRRTSALITMGVLTALSLLVCTTTFALLAKSESVTEAVKANFIVNFPLCLLVCAIDYWLITWLHGHTKGQHYKRILCDITLTLAIGAALPLLVQQLIAPQKEPLETVLAFVTWNSMVVLGIEIFIYHKGMMEQEATLARIEKEKAAYQYEALKNQINPHFLFNSLNVLASLAYQDAEKANLFAKKLSYVYRYLLTTYERKLVPLSEELSFLNAYTYLEQIRFGRAMHVSVNIPDQAMRHAVVPASLQMLVENALKHNICTNEQPLNITITATDEAITVSNNLQTRNDVATNKVGLSNLRSQYLIYNKGINVEKTSTTFAVTLPLLPIH